MKDKIAWYVIAVAILFAAAWVGFCVLLVYALVQIGYLV